MFEVRDLRQVDLGDIRLNDRLETILEAFTNNSDSSIPQACKSAAATKAVYRFFSNDNVEVKELRAGFRKAVVFRIKNCPKGATILYLSDGTNLVFSSHKKLQGIGVLRNQKAKGLNLHTTLVSTEEEVVLGVVEQHCWGRKPEDYGQRALRSKKPIEEKESYRWIESFRASQSSLPSNKKGIFLADRGADIYEIFLEPRKENMHLLIRALHDRKLVDSHERMFEELEHSPCAGIMEVTINRSGERKERVARLEIRYKNVTIEPPKNKNFFPQINITIISAKEIFDGVNGQNLVNWRLLTTLPISSLEDAIYAVKTYAKRWLIERFHYVLKEGCKVEELQLEKAERIERAVTVYTVIACRLMYITYLARAAPDLPCTAAFDDDEWRALHCYVHKTPIEPPNPPSLREALLMLAKIGGFLSRKRDGEPGVKVVWRGMRVLEGAVEMYRILKGKDVGNA